MARKPRIEVEGGLYHVITRGVDRRDIFHERADHERFLAMIGEQKSKLPFYLYAYCLMTNHIHLLIERMTDDVGRIMHRLLTGYGQYYNRKYRRTGHLFQGRHRAILCQSDAYLAELVRYIHLNPVRAKMVKRTEDYPYSSHRAYMGLEPTGPVDVDPVLRHFGPRKEAARERFAAHVAEGMKMGHLARLYQTESGVLGNEDFVDLMVHRIGEYKPKGTPRASNAKEIDTDDLITAVEEVFGLSREDFCGTAKGTRIIEAREALILTGRRFGVSARQLSDITGLGIATISRRHEAALRKLKTPGELERNVNDILKKLQDQHKISNNGGLTPDST